MKKEFNSVTDKSPQNNQQKGFSKTLAQHLHLKDERLYYTHSNENLLRQKIYQFITENAQGDAANQLMNDPDLTEIIGTDAASQPSLSRFYPRFDAKSMKQLIQGNQELLDKAHQFRDSQGLIFDLDSTHADSYVEQEFNAFNSHYGTVGLFCWHNGRLYESPTSTKQYLYIQWSGGFCKTSYRTLQRKIPGDYTVLTWG